jgi:hypothetical protein
MCSSLVMAAQAKNRCFQVVRRGRSKLVNEAPLADSFWSDIAIVREMLTTTWSPTVNASEVCGFLAFTVSTLPSGRLIATVPLPCADEQNGASSARCRKVAGRGRKTHSFDAGSSHSRAAFSRTDCASSGVCGARKPVMTNSSTPASRYLFKSSAVMGLPELETASSNSER